jgi:hypothetical protein
MTWIFSTTLWPSNMEKDHLRNINSFTLPKFGKYQTNNSSKSFSVGVMAVSHTTHLL